MGLFNFGGVSQNKYEKLLEAYELLYRVAVYNRVALICITQENMKDITPEEAAEKLFGKFSIGQINYIKELHENVNASADKTVELLLLEAGAKDAVNKMFPNG